MTLCALACSPNTSHHASLYRVCCLQLLCMVPVAHWSLLCNPESAGTFAWPSHRRLGDAQTTPPSRPHSAWRLVNCCWQRTGWAPLAAAAAPQPPLQHLLLSSGLAAHAATASHPPTHAAAGAVQHKHSVTCRCMCWMRSCRWRPIRCQLGRLRPGRLLPRGCALCTQCDHGRCSVECPRPTVANALQQTQHAVLRSPFLSSLVN